MRRIKFMKRHPLGIILFCYLGGSSGIIFLFSLKDMKWILSIVCLMIIILTYFLCFISDIYGIKINEKYIIFRDKFARKKYLLNEIKNIEVWFKKKNKHYIVEMRISFNKTYTKKNFSWDEVNITRLGFIKTKINDNNINEFVNLFKTLDKFYVYPVK